MFTMADYTKLIITTTQSQDKQKSLPSFLQKAASESVVVNLLYT